MIRYFLILSIAFTSCASTRILERLPASEVDLHARANQIDDHYRNGIFGKFKGTGGVELSYHINLVENPVGFIVIVNGRGESHVKYSELIHDLNNIGYSIFTYDHRGQGLSGGRLPEFPLRGHVERFDDYVADLKIFVDQIVKKYAQGNLFLIGHSMGGLISALYLDREPKIFDAAFLSAPAISIETGFPDFAASTKTCLGKSTNYASPSKADPVPGLRFEDKGNVYTGSRARFYYTQQRMNENPRNTVGQPAGNITSLVLGGPTNKWVCETIGAGKELRKSAEIKARAYIFNKRPESTPIFMALAENDAYVRNHVSKNLCNIMNCEAKFYPSKHEPLNERDEIRNPLLNEMDKFFQRSKNKQTQTAL